MSSSAPTRIDHALRTGKEMGDIGTVVIDEVHTLKEEDRGHRLDGLISRLKYTCEQRAARRDEYDGAQWVYLSATVGNPKQLTEALEATLIEFERADPDRTPRHLCGRPGESAGREQARQTQSSTPSPRRGIAGRRSSSTPGGAVTRFRGNWTTRPLPTTPDWTTSAEKTVERKFGEQSSAVVTTAALAAGRLPASQVIFDSLAMGIEWLSVQEFHQMLGRAGRPDYHDTGTVYVLVEPDTVYHNSMEMSEDEVAFKLLKGEMESVMTHYDEPRPSRDARERHSRRQGREGA